MFKIRQLRPNDAPEWFRMRQALWPKHTQSAFEKESVVMLENSQRQPVFVAERTTGGLCGLIELSIRGKAVGCSTSNVGYIEGWYVDPNMRSKGVGRSLVKAAEEWAASMGCSEMASDTTSSYPVSPAAHKALGYEEVKTVYHYRKLLKQAGGTVCRI